VKPFSETYLAIACTKSFNKLQPWVTVLLPLMSSLLVAAVRNTGADAGADVSAQSIRSQSTWLP